MKIENSYATLDPRLYHKQPPNPLTNPQAGHFNPQVAHQIGWADDEFLRQHWVEILGGDIVPDGFEPLAMAYAGHQFGQWAGQLGDGRGLLLAQVIDKDGELTDLHLKGAGLTPYSRMGDGRAVIRSVVREYLAGHALNCLGIRSSNALGFVVSDTPVNRETRERGAALLRTADCHIRFGHFEWVANYAPDLLLYFTRYVIKTYFNPCFDSDTPIQDFLRQVVDKTAKTLADWQLIGFAHGVMNTDNLSITGATIDFGPYGFMERFRPNWINNHSDYQGRYTYQQQPSIGHWNLWTWLNNLIPLCPQDYDKEQWKQDLADCLEHYEPTFLEHYKLGLSQKMGLPHFHTESFDCAMTFLRILQTEQLDYTQSFTRLQEQQYEMIKDDCLDRRQFESFLAQYEQIRANQDMAELNAVMQQANPVYILRNHMAQKAIELAERNDFSEVERLFDLLSHPFERNVALEKAEDLAPLPTDVPEVIVSCSS